MNITKRGSSYQVREMRNGKVFTYTFKYKPSKLEAQTKLNELESKCFAVKKSILNAMKEYTEAKENILSPATLNLYHKIIKRVETDFNKFANADLNALTQIDFQNFINELAKKNKPKTIKNYFGLIRASYDMFAKFDFRITLPKNFNKEPYIPTDAEVSLLLQESKDTRYYIPIRLALYSLRLSEILALTLEDVFDDYILVNKAKVESAYGMVIKTTKTKGSTRKVFVDKELIDLIREQGYIYKGNNKAITEFIVNFCKKNNIQRFTLHKLRHYFATSLHFANVPRKAIEKLGGWSGNSPVLDRIYTHAKNDYDYQNEVQIVMSKLKRP